MIALDEDMVGSDPSIVIALGLKVCLGLFAQTNGMMLIGAHFTPSTTRGNMDLIMNLIANRGGSFKWMAMVSKFACWTGADSGLNTPTKLAQYFRETCGYRGSVLSMDLTAAPASYDVECSNGFVPSLGWRTTPDPLASTPANNANVFALKRTIDRAQALLGIRVAITSLVPCDGSDTKVVHRLPDNVVGFTPIPSTSLRPEGIVMGVGRR
ncbi:MAG TPA: hypothetical protein VHZ07_07715 [Bryobacteraceae bacterium]|jgi:hypothetical protein|nr:hypothetical protein [Bryobacteraceae bacterium]